MRNQCGNWPKEKEFKLYNDNRHETPKVIRRISAEKGEQMVREGKATRIDNEDGTAVLAYQMCMPKAEAASPRLDRTVLMRTSPQSCTAFSRAEIDAIAFTRFRDGRSRTAGLSDLERARRVLNGGRDEDLVEAARNKLNAYRHTH